MSDERTRRGIRSGYGYIIQAVLGIVKYNRK